MILFPVGERRVGWETRNDGWQPTHGHKAIIRLAPDGKSAHLLNIVGSSYKLIHNRELFTRVEDTMRSQMLPEHLHDAKVTDRVSWLGSCVLSRLCVPINQVQTSWCKE